MAPAQKGAPTGDPHLTTFPHPRGRPQSDRADAVSGVNANAHAERFVRSIKEECLNRIIPIGERHFRRAVREYVEHYISNGTIRD